MTGQAGVAAPVSTEEFVRRLLTADEAGIELVDRVIGRTPMWKLRTLRQLLVLKQNLVAEAARLRLHA